MGRRLVDTALAPKRGLVAITGGLHGDLEHRAPNTYWGAIDSFLSANSRHE